MAFETRARRAFAISATGHGVLLALVLAYMRNHPVAPFMERRIDPIEFDLAIAPLSPSSSAAGEGPHDAIEAEIEPATRAPVAPVASAPSSIDAARGAHTRSIESPPGPPLGEPPGAPDTTNPLPPSSAFVAWNPRNASGAARLAQPLRGTDLIDARDTDASRAALNGALAGPARGPAAATSGANGTGDDRVREASAGYLRELVQESSPSNIPGSVPYWRGVARAAGRVFRPPSVPIPSLGETVINTLVAPTATSMDATRRSLGPLAEGRAGRAAELLQYNHPNSDLLQPANTMSARAAATARTTRVEIDVDQDESGRVIATRVVHRSGVSGFDREAIHAVEQAVRTAEVPAIHGVWRSRWAFEVVTSRDPLISALPGLPGAPPNIGVTAEAEFDEVTGEFEMHLPGMAHVRRRVRVISSREVGASAPTRPPPRTGEE